MSNTQESESEIRRLAVFSLLMLWAGLSLGWATALAARAEAPAASAPLPIATPAAAEVEAEPPAAPLPASPSLQRVDFRPNEPQTAQPTRFAAASSMQSGLRPTVNGLQNRFQAPGAVQIPEKANLGAWSVYGLSLPSLAQAPAPLPDPKTTEGVGWIILALAAVVVMANQVSDFWKKNFSQNPPLHETYSTKDDLKREAEANSNDRGEIKSLIQSTSDKTDRLIEKLNGKLDTSITASFEARRRIHKKVEIHGRALAFIAGKERHQHLTSILREVDSQEGDEG